MPRFSSTSRERLATAHPDLQLIFDTVIEEVDCTIICGHRSREAQTVAFESGNSKAQWPESRHNVLPSMAVDAGPYSSQLQAIDWEDVKAFCVFAGVVIATARRLLREGRITHHLRWGGDWDGDGRTVDQKFNDLGHFELIPANGR